MVYIIQFRVAGSVSFHIAHVPLVPRGRIRAGMRLVGGIKMRTCGTGIGCAAIAKFVDMKPVFPRRQACDLRVDFHAIGDWRKCDCPSHLIACSGMQHRNTI